MSNPPQNLVGIWLFAAAGSLLTIPSCSHSTKAGDPGNRGSFEVIEISTGTSPVYPYRVRKVDASGQPTDEILEIHTIEDLKTNARQDNLVLPVGIFADGAPTLPDGSAGNQFFKIRFSHDLDPASILSTAPGAATKSFLTTALSMLAYNSNTEETRVIEGRGFVGGFTVINDGSGNLNMVKAVEADGDGGVRLLADYVGNDGVKRPIPAAVNQGFPRGFSDAAALVSPKTFVFVADSDENLSSFESFPSAATDNTLLRVVITNAVKDSASRILEKEVCTATSVGVDNWPPDVLGFVSGSLRISPGNGETGVSPTTPILVRFNKPVQPTDVGIFLNKRNLTPTGGGVTINVTIAANTFNVIYYADPQTSGDFCNYVVTPAYNLPGGSSIGVTVNNTVVRSLGANLLGNTVQTSFTTGAGPGIVNAPVAPDAIYVGMAGSRPGLKIVDLNGFGQTTGGYMIDPSGNTAPVFDWRNTTRFQFNPNIGSPGIQPNLSKPSDLTASGLDAGSPGVFRLIQDSAGETLLLGEPMLGSVADIHIGCPLDMVFNNSNINVNASSANHLDAFGGTGSGNGFSIVPHPNPPRLVFPPPNTSQAIFAEEPTATNTACTRQPLNLLVSGNPDGPPALGLFGHALEIFNGPTARPGSPPPPTPFCPFGARQQIGHFLYILDGDNKFILVVNSNRMTVLDTIRTSDPVDFAMSPDLRRLAVSNSSSGTISFIDIDPTSATFHQITGETRVAPGPGAVTWQPDGEDILVVHPRENALTIINGVDLQVTKTIRGFLDNPIGIAVTDRHARGRGNGTGLYFAYILNGNGTVAVYESGPNGVNGIGFNELVGTVPGVTFRRPRHISIDLSSVNSGVFVSHSDEQGRGMVSRLEMTMSPGLQPISQNNGGILLPPTFRQKVWSVTQTFGGGTGTGSRDQLSGTPGEIATDEMFNLADLPNQSTPRTGVVPVSPFGGSEKGHVKNGGQAVRPKFLFISIVDRGKIDVFRLGTAEKIRTIDVGGVPSVISSYWRQ